eukprot:262345_1
MTLKISLIIVAVACTRFCESREYNCNYVHTTLYGGDKNVIVPGYCNIERYNENWIYECEEDQSITYKEWSNNTNCTGIPDIIIYNSTEQHYCGGYDCYVIQTNYWTNETTPCDQFDVSGNEWHGSKSLVTLATHVCYHLEGERYAINTCYVYEGREYKYRSEYLNANCSLSRGYGTETQNSCVDNAGCDICIYYFNVRNIQCQYYPTTAPTEIPTNDPTNNPSFADLGRVQSTVVNAAIGKNNEYMLFHICLNGAVLYAYFM